MGRAGDFDPTDLGRRNSCGLETLSSASSYHLNEDLTVGVDRHSPPMERLCRTLTNSI